MSTSSKRLRSEEYSPDELMRLVDFFANVTDHDTNAKVLRHLIQNQWQKAKTLMQTKTNPLLFLPQMYHTEQAIGWKRQKSELQIESPPEKDADADPDADIRKQLLDLVGLFALGTDPNTNAEVLIHLIQNRSEAKTLMHTTTERLSLLVSKYKPQQHKRSNIKSEYPLKLLRDCRIKVEVGKKKSSRTRQKKVKSKTYAK